MRSFFIFFILALSVSASFIHSAPSSSLPLEESHSLISDQLAKLDLLIRATEQSLEGEKKLREMIKEYKKIEALFLQHPEDNDVLFTMVKQAFKVLEMIKETHLLHAFDAEFIDELTVLAQAASKRGIPKP